MNYELGIMNYELEKTELGGWFLARRTLRLNLRGGFETVVSRWFRRFFRARAAVAWRGNDSRRGLLFLPSSAPRALFLLRVNDDDIGVKHERAQDFQFCRV